MKLRFSRAASTAASAALTAASAASLRLDVVVQLALRDRPLLRERRVASHVRSARPSWARASAELRFGLCERDLETDARRPRTARRLCGRARLPVIPFHEIPGDLRPDLRVGIAVERRDPLAGHLHRSRARPERPRTVGGGADGGAGAASFLVQPADEDRPPNRPPCIEGWNARSWCHGVASRNASRIAASVTDCVIETCSDVDRLLSIGCDSVPLGAHVVPSGPLVARLGAGRRVMQRMTLDGVRAAAPGGCAPCSTSGRCSRRSRPSCSPCCRTTV